MRGLVCQEEFCSSAVTNLTMLLIILHVSKLKSVGVYFKVNAIVILHTVLVVVFSEQNESSPSLPVCKTDP